MIFSRLKPMLVALFLFSLTVFFMGFLTQALLDLFWLKPAVIETIGLSAPTEIIQGSIVQHKALSTEEILPVFGSSELSSGYNFNGSKIFNGKPTGFTPFKIGRGNYQCLTHTINLAGQGDLNNKKVAIILLIDWFLPGGLSSSNLEQNFSPLQVYQVIFNPSLPEQIKLSIVSRVLQYPQVLKGYPILSSYLKAYEYSSWKKFLSKLILWPIARVDFASLQLQDALKTIKIIKKLDPKDIAKNSTAPSSQGSLKWEKLQEEANKQGKAAITNEYGVLDARLSEWIKNKDSMNSVKLYKSPEYQDLEILLRTLQAKGAKPLFIISPANGPWYDFKGFSISERQQHYQRLREIIGQYGFVIADLSPHEYEPYFMQDPWHFGWKGWVDVDEILDNFYHGKQVL